MNIIVSAIIFVAVIGILVYITINNKKEEPTNTGTEQKMENNQGLKVTILKEGTGDVVKNGDTVSMKYTGKLADGTVFDSNIDPKFNHTDPFEFTIGDTRIIKGWNIGIVGMKVGEKRILEISPELAYGERGAGNVIPPNATLSFEVELLGIKK